MLIKFIGAFAGACLVAGCATNQSSMVSGFSTAASSATAETSVVGLEQPATTQCWKETRPGSRLLVTRCATVSQRQAEADAAQALTERMKREQSRRVPGRY